jgi:hypothetical protein
VAAEESAMVKFVDDDEGYFAWVRSHREGIGMHAERAVNPDDRAG